MKYCVNCSRGYERPVPVCPGCKSDQAIPNEFIESVLQKYRSTPVPPYDPLFGFPGEKTALAFSIAIVAVITVILGMLSLGLFVVLLLINIIAIRGSCKSPKTGQFVISSETRNLL